MNCTGKHREYPASFVIPIKRSPQQKIAIYPFTQKGRRIVRRKALDLSYHNKLDES